MKLIVVIPCLNEEKTIGSVIASIPNQIEGVDQIEVIVVDDGSTDRTADLAREQGASVTSHTVNMGVGVAFQSGLEAALESQADVMVNIDGDGQFNPADIAEVVAPILAQEADFVTASRFIEPTMVPVMPAIKKWGNRRMSQLVSALIGGRFHDVSCGFRAFSREAMLHINLFGTFTYTQEVFLNLAFKGLRIKEIPIAVRGVREFGSSRVANNLWKYAYNTSKIIFRAYRDYKPLRFFGFFAAMTSVIAVILGTFFFTHYFVTGVFRGHLWAGFSSGFLFVLGVALSITGLIADMLGRIRLNQESILYFQKRKHYYNN